MLARFKPKRIIDNPSEEELSAWSLERGGKVTQFGNLSVVTKVRNRIAKLTEVIMDNPSKETRDFINRVLDYLQSKEMIRLDRTMCQNPEFKTPSRLYVTSDYPRLPLMWGSTLFPAEGKNPEFVTIAVPEWEEKKTLVFPKRGLTLTAGTDYKGECKKAMLRQLMYKAKQKGCLGCHAGSKIMRLKTNGGLKDFGLLFFGLSGTGKTSLTCHHHWLKHPEKVVIRQDDVVILTSDGRAVGTEASYYIKTEKLEPGTQPLLYAAAISPRAILENVKVDELGKVDFSDTTLTSNGRAMVKRSDVAFTDAEIDLPEVDFIFFVTRRYDIMSPIIKLPTPEWGACAFMLGESVETSAGDPAEAGRSIRVVGTNPFIVGSAAQEGNIFHEILKANPSIQCFILNTGSVGGERGQNISLTDTVKIIEMAVRNKIKWQEDKFWGYQVPTEIPGIDMYRFDIERYYHEEEIQRCSQMLKDERLKWLSRFEKRGLDSSIIKVLNP
jgi:phosphoenolpyruvate carboxykinase (ATP)